MKFEPGHFYFLHEAPKRYMTNKTTLNALECTEDLTEYK